MNDSVAVKPVAPYIGGKAKLAQILVQRIGGIEHQCYAEVFMGMGEVFLRRPERAKCEVINDYHREVATFFRVLQRHYVAFLEMLRFQITTRAEFDRLIKTDPDTLTDLEKAARFLYLQRTAYGGKRTGRVFGVSKSGPARFDVTKLQPLLEDLRTRLNRVVIECLSFEEFIPRYDTPQTLFYLDPPYVLCEDDYGKGLFQRRGFEVIREVVSRIQGRFILSLNDGPGVRELYSEFRVEEVKTTYSLPADSVKPVTELLISNG